jgi:hypothetical protein
MCLWDDIGMPFGWIVFHNNVVWVFPEPSPGINVNWCSVAFSHALWHNFVAPNRRQLFFDTNDLETLILSKSRCTNTMTLFVFTRE